MRPRRCSVLMKHDIAPSRQPDVACRGVREVTAIISAERGSLIKLVCLRLPLIFLEFQRPLDERRSTGFYS
jgi:hypothetical protein